MYGKSVINGGSGGNIIGGVRSGMLLDAVECGALHTIAFIVCERARSMIHAR